MPTEMGSPGERMSVFTCGSSPMLAPAFRTGAWVVNYFLMPSRSNEALYRPTSIRCR